MMAVLSMGVPSGISSREATYAEAVQAASSSRLRREMTLNRVASSSFASTIKGVIYESGQFSPAGSGWLDSVIANGSIPSSCYDAADAALAGENPIGSAMYFNTGSGKGIKIGAHQFY